MSKRAFPAADGLATLVDFATASNAVIGAVTAAGMAIFSP